MVTKTDWLVAVSITEHGDVASVSLAAAKGGENIEGEGVATEALQQGGSQSVWVRAILPRHLAEEELQETQVILILQLKLPGHYHRRVREGLSSPTAGSWAGPLDLLLDALTHHYLSARSYLSYLYARSYLSYLFALSYLSYLSARSCNITLLLLLKTKRVDTVNSED